MAKKLITVCWSATVEMDVPESLVDVTAVDFNSPPEYQDFALKATKEAWANVQCSDGVITDEQDVE